MSDTDDANIEQLIKYNVRLALAHQQSRQHESARYRRKPP